MVVNFNPTVFNFVENNIATGKVSNNFINFFCVDGNDAVDLIDGRILPHKPGFKIGRCKGDAVIGGLNKNIGRDG